MAGPGGDGDLRRLLKLHRTEIAMAVDDVFPLLHGLADHDVVPEHIFKETLSRAEREGSQRAFHALLTWLLGRDAAALRDFWAVLFKDYNLERYARLRPVRGAFPREAELGRQRRGRRLSPSPTAPAPHRPQGKRKAPEERDKARAAQPSPRHTTSPGPLAKAKTVKKPEGADTPRTPRAGGECQPPQGSICLCPLFAHSHGQGAAHPTEPPSTAALQAVAASVQRAVAVAGGEVPISRGAIESILIKHVLEPATLIHERKLELPLAPLAGSSRTGSRAGNEPYTQAARDEPGARSRSHSLKPPAQPKASQSNREPQLHPQGQLPVPTTYSQQPVPLQENEDECAACGDGGELICCDGCPRAFHLTCLVPPLPRVPSGTWRCGSCVTSVAEPGQLLEADVAVQRPPEIAGEEGCDTRLGGADASVCSRCFTRIPTPQHCPAPSAEPRGLLLCTSCTRTPDMGSLDTTTAAGDQPAQAAKVSTTRARERWESGYRERGRTSLLPQAEEGALSSDPVLSRDELDALLGEGTWDGILQWAFQSMARPLADTHGLLA
ncbi:autoimmune regulator [Pipra filicauda]|uniref:Autoimmune regulator n=1 Tax=Pipra filicauda TaxID=649802 RepID=A0A7R5L8D5_9PASS|nr:autoimmune regulator [Pipra filicauda]